jgi:two-component system response regulator (stage 0 sporulation protein F)
MPATQTDGATPQLVVVVEDEAQIALALQTLLSFKGIASSLHESAESLLSALSLRDGRLWLTSGNGTSAMVKSVLLDMNLPGMNGADLVLELRRMQPDLMMVMMTAAQEEQLKERAPDLQGVTLLSKPFSLESLERALLVA